MALWVTAADVRTYANLDGTTGRYSNASIHSNTLAAQALIEQRSGRTFDQSTGTRYFTTEGRAQLAIPDLRSASSVTLSGSTLTANETYYLIPDGAYPSVYVAIQFRPFSRGRQPWYLSVPDWWDRGLDMPNGYEGSSLPNDLAITGDWGWDHVPSDVLHATKVLAAWLTKRADALLGNAVATPDGSVYAYDRFPPELDAIIATYKTGEQVISVS